MIDQGKLFSAFCLRSASCLASGAFQGVFLHRCCYLVCVQSWQSTRPECCSLHFHKYSSVSAVSTPKKSVIQWQGSSSELYTPDETFNDNPSEVSCGKV